MNDHALKNSRGGDEGKGEKLVYMFMEQSASGLMSGVFGNMICQ